MTDDAPFDPADAFERTLFKVSVLILIGAIWIWLVAFTGRFVTIYS